MCFKKMKWHVFIVVQILLHVQCGCSLVINLATATKNSYNIRAVVEQLSCLACCYCSSSLVLFVYYVRCASPTPTLGLFPLSNSLATFTLNCIP